MSGRSSGQNPGRIKTMTSISLAAQIRGTPHRAVMLLGIVTLLAWVGYSFAAALQPACPHGTDASLTPYGLSRLVADPADTPQAWRLQEAIDAAACCEELHDGALAQPALLALSSPSRLFVAAPVLTAGMALPVAALSPSGRAPRAFLPAGTKL
jgi:hypothetical protein